MSTHNPPEADLIESRVVLEDHCRRWSQAPALALDTEFVRTRTFFAQLGLIQVADGSRCSLVDAVAIDDLSPLSAILTDPAIVKVLHSGAEDLEVFFQVFRAFPEPIFDTQIAATLAGHGNSLGYQRLVELLFDLELPKGETRSNWLRRPLSGAQIEYAALDVAYLLPSFELLSQELESGSRMGWAEEEFGRLVETTRGRLDPDYSFRRLAAGQKLAPRDLALLRELCAWREKEARERDLPRGFVASDDTLVQLMRRRPVKVQQLAAIAGLSPGERSRSGDELVERIRAVLDLPDASLPPDRRGRRVAMGRSRGRVDALRKLVQEVASELGLPPEFLARRRLLEDLIRNLRRGASEPLPEPLRGWRRPVIGDRLLELGRRLEG